MAFGVILSWCLFIDILNWCSDLWNIPLTGRNKTVLKLTVPSTLTILFFIHPILIILAIIFSWPDRYLVQIWFSYTKQYNKYTSCQLSVSFQNCVLLWRIYLVFSTPKYTIGCITLDCHSPNIFCRCRYEINFKLLYKYHLGSYKLLGYKSERLFLVM